MSQSERLKKVLEEKSSVEAGDLFVLRVDEIGSETTLVQETLAAFAKDHGVRFLLVPLETELEHLGRVELEALGYRWVGRSPIVGAPSPCCTEFCPHVQWFDKHQTVVQCCRCGKKLDGDGGDLEIVKVEGHGSKLSSRCGQPPIPHSAVRVYPTCPACGGTYPPGEAAKRADGKVVCSDCLDPVCPGCGGTECDPEVGCKHGKRSG